MIKGAIAIVAVLAIPALLAALAIEHTTATTLPVPTGPLPVGRTTLDWIGDTRAGAERELLAWLWYPSEPSSVEEDYIPGRTRAEVDRDRGVLFGKFLTRDLSKVRAHSFSNAEVSRQRQSYPVVIMRGGASLEVWNYSTRPKIWPATAISSRASTHRIARISSSSPMAGS